MASGDHGVGVGRVIWLAAIGIWLVAIGVWLVAIGVWLADRLLVGAAVAATRAVLAHYRSVVFDHRGQEFGAGLGLVRVVGVVEPARDGAPGYGSTPRIAESETAEESVSSGEFRSPHGSYGWHGPLAGWLDSRWARTV